MEVSNGVKKIGIIGAGNMGEAIIKGLVSWPCLFSCNYVIVSDSSSDRLKYIKKNYKVKTVSYNEELIVLVDVIILAVKPQHIYDVLSEIGKFIDQQKLVISVAAGIKIKCIESRLSGKAPVIRVMPNMPALAQKGVSAFCCGRFAEDRHKKAAFNILSNIGEVVEVKERMMDAVTAISGSGPAYFFFLMEQLIKIGVNEGLDRNIAVKLAVQTALGAAELARQNNNDPQELRARVTSKGGTTEAAFKIFEKEGLGKILEKGVKAAIKRSKELSCL